MALVAQDDVTEQSAGDVTQPLKNRWLIAACAVGIQVSIGAVYAYSVMSKPVAHLFDVTPDKVKVAFSIAIVVLGLSAAFLGKVVEKLGPRRSGMIAATCWGLGLIGAGLAIRLNSLALFYAFYGALGGIGLGIGYIAPVSTLVRWFPDKRGFASGLAIMGFGFAAMLAAPAMAALFNAGTTEAPVYTVASVSRTFFLCGFVYLTVMMLAAQYLSPPPAGYWPAGAPRPLAKGTSVKAIKGSSVELSGNEALRTRRFLLLWLMFAINIICGITLIADASPMVQSMLKLDPLQASGVVGLIGVFNGLGRIAWSSASDRIGRPATFTLFFIIEAIAFLSLPSISHGLLFQATLCLILSCYGGGFATIPAFLGDLFGTRHLGPLLGYTLTAWSLAAVVGPSVLIPLLKHDGVTNYPVLLYVCAGLMLVALAASLLLTHEIRKTRLPAT